MKTSYMKVQKLIVLSLGLSLTAFAGNEQRSGQAGGQELLINPFARTSGWGAANSASVKGLEASYTNIAGIAHTKKTEVLFSNTNYLVGTGIKINTFGLTQRVGETGALGISFMSMDFGDIAITTVDNPEGTLGNFSPNFSNFSLSYAKGFSDNIFGGVTVKGISEAMSNVKARGIALDAGVQYIAGKKGNLKFGIAIKNIGPKMKFSGDGLSFTTPLPADPTATQGITVENRSASFELPSLLNIGGSYDIYLMKKDSAHAKDYRLSVAATFTSNAFSRDEYRTGVEFAFKEMFMVRAGMVLQKKIFDVTERTTVFTGPTAGATVELPFNTKKSTFALDYSFRSTNPFSGVHSIGVRMNL